MSARECGDFRVNEYKANLSSQKYYRLRQQVKPIAAVIDNEPKF